MHDYDEDNDGRFPDESPVEVRYPRSKQEERSRKSRVTLSGWILLEVRSPEGSGLPSLCRGATRI